MLTAHPAARCDLRRRRHAASPFALADVPAEDPAVYDDDQPRRHRRRVPDRVARADGHAAAAASRARFYDLVIEVAIVRPGPIQGGMVHPYLRRRERRGAGRPTRTDDAAQRAGAHAGRADLPGAGDAARRGRRRLHARRGRPAAPRDGGLAAQGRAGAVPRAALVGGMARARLSAPSSPSRSSSRSCGFGEYGFPESHAASFALLVYVSAWLKCHHPAAFACRAAQQPADGLLRARRS
ncbi:MAG: hypothetical protein MZW92_25160 [Comamonadaceae bacterium]|nr:hypothetical protein [Comamonadaceae bacterium]